MLYGPQSSGGWTSSSIVLSQVARERPNSSLLVVLEQRDDTVVIFLRGRASQVSKEPQAKGHHPIGNWQAPGNTPDCLVGSVPGVRIRKIFRKHQVSKASRRFSRTVHVSHPYSRTGSM